MENKLKANGYRIIKLALVCCALLTFSVMGIVTILPQIHATNQRALDTPTDTPTPTATPITPTATPITPTATPDPTAVPTTPPPTVVPTTPPIIVRPTATPIRIPTVILAPPVTATSIASQTATAVASATAGITATPTGTVGATSSPTVVATQQAVAAPAGNTPPPGNGGGPNIVLPVTIGLVMLLIAGGLGGLVLLRKRGIPAFGLAGLGSNGQKTPSIPWTRNKKIGPAPVIDNGNAPPPLQAGAFAASGQAWTAPNNAQTMIASSAPAFAGAAGMLAPNSQPLMPSSNQPYTPSALRPITTSLPAEYPNSRPLNTIQTSDMRPLPMDSLDFSKVFNQQADVDRLRQVSPQLAPGAYAGVATQLTRPATAPLPVPPPNTPAPAGGQTTGPAAVPLQAPTPPPARPATPPPPPVVSLLNESQLTSDPMLETIMRQAQMGLYVLPDKQTPSKGNSNH